MSSKKSKSRKDKRYKGPTATSPSSEVIHGEWTLLNKTRDAMDRAISSQLGVCQWASQSGIWDLVAEHGDLPLLQQRLQTFAGDIDSVRARFQEAAAQHQGRFGQSKSPDDMMQSVDIHGIYVEIGETMEQLLVPVSLAITEQVEHASANRLLQINKQVAPATESTETREPE